MHAVFTVSFDPPPSPLGTQDVIPTHIGWALICVFQVSLAHQDDAVILSGSGYLKKRSECRSGLDGDCPPLLDGVHVDSIEHGQLVGRAIT